MHLLTDEQIGNMRTQDILEFMATAQCKPNSDALYEAPQQKLKRSQRNRTLVMWHDHSTIYKEDTYSLQCG